MTKTWDDLCRTMHMQFRAMRTSELIFLLGNAASLTDVVLEASGYDRSNPDTWLPAAQVANHVTELQRLVMRVIDERVPIPAES